MVSSFCASLKQHVSSLTVWNMVLMKPNCLPVGLCSVGTSEEVFPLIFSLEEASSPYSLSVSG